MQSLHHLLTYVVHDIDHMLRYLLSIYLSSMSISYRIACSLVLCRYLFGGELEY